MRLISLLSTLLIAGWSDAKPQSDKVWDVEALSSEEQRPAGRSPNYTNSKPTKIRLVNYEQRQLAQRQQSTHGSYLGMVRQKMRGAPTQVISTGIQPTGVLTEIAPAASATETTPTPMPEATIRTTLKSGPIDSLPEFDMLHKARELFDMRKDGSPIAPISELEIKDDHQLLKSMQRTTVRMRQYPTDGIDADTNDSDAAFLQTTTPLSATPQTASVETVTPVLQPKSTNLPFVVLPGFTAPTFPPIPQANLTAVVPPYLPSGLGIAPAVAPSTVAPQFEQLGCNWDILSNSCKDVFALGWCLGCEDFGNVFLHDCRCTAPAPKPNTTEATRPPATSFGGSLGGPPPPPPVPEALVAPQMPHLGGGFLQQQNRFLGFV